MDQIYQETEEKMKAAILSLEKRLVNIRAGRANPAILDDVMVSYYGVDTPLKQMATISVPEARQLAIKPYDRTTIASIEKAIYEANIGLTPNNNGEVIILNIPVLTEETRREYVKQAHGVGEDARIALRNIRANANNEIKKIEAPEDDKKAYQEDIQNLIQKYNKIVDEKIQVKEKELMIV